MVITLKIYTAMILSLIRNHVQFVQFFNYYCLIYCLPFRLYLDNVLAVDLTNHSDIHQTILISPHKNKINFMLLYYLITA